MGQSISCSICKKCPSINRIIYENNDVDKYLEQVKLLEPIKGKIIPFAGLDEIQKYLNSKINEIKHIVGYISVYYIPHKNIAHMHQYLCEYCYDEIYLEDLPLEWGYKVMLKSDGWVKFLLP